MKCPACRHNNRTSHYICRNCGKVYQDGQESTFWETVGDVLILIVIICLCYWMGTVNLLNNF